MNITLLIDADNSSAKHIRSILTKMAGYGKVNIRRAYGNWTSPHLSGWQSVLHDYAIQPIQQYDLTKGKNATDIALTIDAMDIIYTKQVDAFCIVTSDCDFTPLVTRVLADGKTVFGCGQQKTPSAFVNACSAFIYLDEESEGDAEADSGKEATKEPAKEQNNDSQPDKSLLKLLRNAVATTKENDGWSKLSRVGTLISNHNGFDPKCYGHSSLSKLLAATEIFELKRDSKNSYLVRTQSR